MGPPPGRWPAAPPWPLGEDGTGSWLAGGGEDFPKSGLTGEESFGALSPAGGVGSTKVAANLMVNVWGVNTVGGRQALRVQHGVLDLRWHCNQGFYSGYAKSGTFDPAGTGSTFGFLRWCTIIGPAQHSSGQFGLSRCIAGADTNVPEDPRDPNGYNTTAGRYFRYDAYESTYYYYNSGSLSIPRYVARTYDRWGYSLYYQYDGDKLTAITGDVGRLVPYFGYDASGHINRMFLQDADGQEHRETYYKYDANGGLTAIAEPENAVSYFAVDPSAWRVDRELDPDGYPTYLVYS